MRIQLLKQKPIDDDRVEIIVRRQNGDREPYETKRSSLPDSLILDDGRIEPRAIAYRVCGETDWERLIALLADSKLFQIIQGNLIPELSPLYWAMRHAMALDEIRNPLVSRYWTGIQKAISANVNTLAAAGLEWSDDDRLFMQTVFELCNLDQWINDAWEPYSPLLHKSPETYMELFPDAPNPMGDFFALQNP